MKQIISKELLGKVLEIGPIMMNPILEPGNRVGYLVYGSQNTLQEVKNNHKQINLYELAHKCKEWAIKIDYKIESHIHFINKRIIGVASFNTQDNTTKFFQADTEPEAIFKACQWILEQRSNQ